jgi:cell division protein FtsI/penicillin-binding protein 2
MCDFEEIWVGAVAFFLVFLLLILISILLNYLQILGMGKCVLEKDQGYRVAVKPEEFSRGKHVDKEYHVYRSVVVKKPAVFLQKMRSYLLHCL